LNFAYGQTQAYNRSVEKLQSSQRSGGAYSPAPKLINSNYSKASDKLNPSSNVSLGKRQRELEDDQEDQQHFVMEPISAATSSNDQIQKKRDAKSADKDKQSEKVTKPQPEEEDKEEVPGNQLGFVRGEIEV
jgi:hypothetical protein